MGSADGKIEKEWRRQTRMLVEAVRRRPAYGEHTAAYWDDRCGRAASLIIGAMTHRSAEGKGYVDLIEVAFIARAVAYLLVGRQFTCDPERIKRYILGEDARLAPTPEGCDVAARIVDGPPEECGG